MFVSQVRNMETKKCLDNMGRKENEKVGFFNCHGQGGNQVRKKRVLSLHSVSLPPDSDMM